MNTLPFRFLLTLAFNALLVAAAFQFKEFYFAQLAVLLFFPAWWLSSKVSASPPRQLQIGWWFPLMGILVLAAVIALPFWMPGEALRFFKDETLASFGLLFLLPFAGYVSVYFAFSERENRWSRRGLGVAYLVLWWWVFQAVSYRYELMSWLLLVFAVAPIWSRMAELFSESRYAAWLDSDKVVGEKTLLEIIFNNELSAAIRLQAVESLDKDKTLYELYLDEKLEDELTMAAFERIESEAILQQILEEEEESEAVRLSCVARISDETVLLLVLNKIKNKAVQRTIIQKVRQPKVVEAIFEDTSKDLQIRALAAEKITNQSLLFRIFSTERHQPQDFRLVVLQQIIEPIFLEKILLDNSEKDAIRLPVLSKIKDADLFKNGLLRLHSTTSQRQAIRANKIPKVLDSVLQEVSFQPSWRSLAAERLFELNADILSPEFLRYQLDIFLPNFLKNKELNSIIQVLENVPAFYGQFQNLAFLKAHFPTQLLLDWYADLIPVKADDFEGTLSKSRLDLSKADKIRVHWAIGHCLSLLPDKNAVPILRALFVDLENEKRQQSDEEATSSKANYHLDMGIAALLRAFGSCAAEDSSYLNFDKDQKLMEEIDIIQQLMKPKQQEASRLYKKRKALIDNSIGAYMHPSDLQYDPEFQAIEHRLNALVKELQIFKKDRDQKILQLSAANFLMRVANNGQDYSAYIRQHAAAGLQALLERSHLQAPAKKEIADCLEKLRKSHAEIKAEDELNPTEVEAAALEESSKKALPDEETDPRFSTYELRLMPQTKMGTLNYLLHDVLRQLASLGDPLPTLPQLLHTVKELLHSLPEARQFLEKHPLRLMPFAMRNRLAYYRETGYNLNLWTRYIPPKDTPGNVQFRYLEVEDYTQPNSMGMVYQLFFHPLLAVPVLFHEFQHYLGKKNEAVVWLLENYFLRRRIIERAPKDPAALAKYFDFIVALFLQRQDILTLSLLRTNFHDPATLRCFNQLITKYYGRQLNPNEARQAARNTILRENTMIQLTNMMLHWDPLKRYPLLGQVGAEEEGELAQRIVLERRMQKNTLNKAELTKLLADPELVETDCAWADLLAQLDGGASVFDAFPDLCTLLGDASRAGDLLVYKS